jgi:hypothetical protein
MLRSPAEAIAFGIQGDNVLVALENGSILVHDIATEKSSVRQIGIMNVRNLQFYENDIFGFCSDNRPFKWSDGKLVQCPYAVKGFSVINPDILFVLEQDDIARVVAVDGWHPISRNHGPIDLNPKVVQHIVNHPLANQKCGRLVDQDEFLATVEELDGQSEYLWFRPAARMIWASFRKDVPMYLRGHYATGDAHQYDVILAKLNSYVENISNEFQWTKARCELFADHFPDAAIALSGAHDETNIELSAAVAGCIIACEQEASDRLKVHLKAMATTLFLHEQYLQGATFLRMARLDKIGAEYLLEYDQIDLAMKFIRALEGQEKQVLLLKFGLKMFLSDHLADALMIFVNCSQFHLVLYLMHLTKLYFDVFFVKKYLILKGYLKPAPDHVATLIPQLPDLMILGAQIDSDFALEATEVGVDPKILKRLLSCSQL